MQLSQTLEIIAKEYPNGCVEFFDVLPNNPWQAAHDRLEGGMLLYRDTPQYFEKMNQACDEFLKEIRKLMALYRAANPEQPLLPNIRDAFVIGGQDAGEEKLRRMQALADSACFLCGTIDDVRAANHRKKGSGIYCPHCLVAEGA